MAAQTEGRLHLSGLHHHDKASSTRASSTTTTATTEQSRSASPAVSAAALSQASTAVQTAVSSGVGESRAPSQAQDHLAETKALQQESVAEYIFHFGRRAWRVPMPPGGVWQSAVLIQSRGCLTGSSHVVSPPAKPQSAPASGAASALQPAVSSCGTFVCATTASWPRCKCVLGNCCIAAPRRASAFASSVDSCFFRGMLRDCLWHARLLLFRVAPCCVRLFFLSFLPCAPHAHVLMGAPRRLCFAVRVGSHLNLTAPLPLSSNRRNPTATSSA